jgi:hypothetical protein
MKTIVSGLGVVLTIQPSRVYDLGKLKVHVVLSNESSAPIRLVSLFLHYGTVLFEARYEGLPLPRPPPPFPPEDDPVTGRMTLAPGETAAFDYNGAETMQLPARVGHYEVRYRYANEYTEQGEWKGVLTSQWLPFEIIPPPRFP